MIDLFSSFSDDKKFRFSCEECGKRYSVAAGSLGRIGKCSKCNGRISVPNPCFDVVTTESKFFSVSLARAATLLLSGFIEPEEAFAKVDDQTIPLMEVFPIDAINCIPFDHATFCLFDESVIYEVSELFPEETNYFARSDGPLIDCFAYIKSERKHIYFVAFSILGTSRDSAWIHFSVTLADDNPKLQNVSFRVNKAVLGYSEFLIGGLDPTDGGAVAGSSDVARVYSNMKAKLSNDVNFNVTYETASGIAVPDDLTLPGAALERLLIRVDPVCRSRTCGSDCTCSTFGGLTRFDEQSKVVFYENLQNYTPDTGLDIEEAGDLKIVYILVNPSMPGIVKIGRTTQGVQLRMGQLNTTGVAQPYECFYAAHVHDDVVVEKTLHERFAKYRVNERREFFEVPPQKVMRELFEFDLGDATET